MVSADKKEERAVWTKSPSSAGRRQGEERLSGEQVLEGALCFTKNMGFLWAVGEGSAHAFKRRDHFRKSSLRAGMANALRLEGGDLFHESLIHAHGSVDKEEHPDKRIF